MHGRWRRHCLPIEFRQVQGHFPIVFRRDIESGKVSALALFGFENGENLFLDGARWDARYRPLALAIQPFLIGKRTGGDDAAQVHVDLAHPRIVIGGVGTRAFDEHGKPTPSLDALLRGARAPFVIRGLVKDWPLVQAGLQSPRDARRYLLERARPVPFAVSIGSPGNEGRLFYDTGMAMNFRMARGKLADIFAAIDANEDRAEPPTIYLGSIDNTLAGRAVSMVDFHAPDFSAHPRFARALDHAQVAELEPGDALFIPSMWWHHVERLARFNVLLNCWWRDTPRFLGQPQAALNHTVLSIRDLPPEVILGVPCRSCPEALEDTILGTLRFGKKWPEHVHAGREFHFPQGLNGFHTYAIEWQNDRIAWQVDGR